MEEIHQPVLSQSVLECLAPRRGESYLDLTAGYAGHAKLILDATQNYKGTVLVDRDANACEYIRQKFLDLARQGDAPAAAADDLTIKNVDFYSAAWQERECGHQFDLILADLGVSSPQLDNGNRGFSFLHDGPLDMRMDARDDLTAADILNHWNAAQIAEIFVKYGEISPARARSLAPLLVQRRPWRSTRQLADFIKAHSPYSRRHPATLVFQALRIAVNRELELIEKTLPLLPELLTPGGRLAIITFQSLEDRLVKQWLKSETAHGAESRLEHINKHPIVAESEELFINPRARSAKLRAARRTTASR